jgi:hypothetical protein
MTKPPQIFAQKFRAKLGKASLIFASAGVGRVGKLLTLTSAEAGAVLPLELSKF